MTKENIVKRVCKELSITQKELAEKLGVSKPTIERWSAKGDIPESSARMLEMFLENQKLKQELDELKTALKILDKYQRM